MKLVLTEETRERELCAQEEVLVRCRCVLPKLQPLSAGAQRRLERYITELERRWNGACEGWLLEQAVEGARLARRNALPFAPFEAVLDFETTRLDDRFWSVLWRWQVTWQGEAVLLRRWGQVWDLERGMPCRLEQFLPEKRKERRRFWRRLKEAAREAGVRGMGWRHGLVWCTLTEAELVCGWASLANPVSDSDFFTVSTPFSEETVQFC